MKIFETFLLLMLSIQILSLSENNEIIYLDANNIINITMNAAEKKNLSLPGGEGDKYFLTILALTKGVKISINQVVDFGGSNNNPNIEPKENIFTHSRESDKYRNIEFSIDKNSTVEISSVLINETNKANEYKKIDYKVDSKIQVDKNNFVIFLEDEKIENFEMKFKFKDNIKNINVTYGFIYLPIKDEKYLVLGKNYKTGTDNKLEQKNFPESEMELKVNNPYYDGEMKKPENKDHFAFIFSIDDGEKMVGDFNFTINSEIINLFLIISIAVALVFAVITFFLIRRKQTSEESSNLEGEDSKEEKIVNEEKEEKEEKDDKEISSEN